MWTNNCRIPVPPSVLRNVNSKKQTPSTDGGTDEGTDGGTLQVPTRVPGGNELQQNFSTDAGTTIYISGYPPAPSSFRLGLNRSFFAHVGRRPPHPVSLSISIMENQQ
jgi:hypothetical protein